MDKRRDLKIWLHSIYLRATLRLNWSSTVISILKTTGISSCVPEFVDFSCQQQHRTSRNLIRIESGSIELISQLKFLTYRCNFTILHARMLPNSLDLFSSKQNI